MSCLYYLAAQREPNLPAARRSNAWMPSRRWPPKGAADALWMDGQLPLPLLAARSCSPANSSRYFAACRSPSSDAKGMDCEVATSTAPPPTADSRKRSKSSSSRSRAKPARTASLATSLWTHGRSMWGRYCSIHTRGPATSFGGASLAPSLAIRVACSSLLLAQRVSSSHRLRPLQLPLPPSVLPLTLSGGR